MSADRVGRAAALAGAGLAAAAGLAQLGLLLYIFIHRVGYPFDLEWMEGGMLCHALQVMQGKPIYAAPSVEFIPYLYTPFYPWVLAVLGKLVGLGYPLGRVISVLSFGGVLTLALLAVRREAGKGVGGWLWGLGAVGLIAATFPHTGAWYDLVRNDSLYLLLIFGALYLVRYRSTSWRWLIVAGVLAGLAFLTKQTASMFIILSGLGLLVLNWRRLPVYVAVVGLVAGGAVLLLNALSDGWFWRYTFELHQGHDLYWERVWPQTELKLLSIFPAVGAVMGLWVLVLGGDWIRRRRLPAEDRSLLYWLAVALTGVAVSAVGFATQWAVQNAYIPGLVFCGIFACMAGANLARRWGGKGVTVAGALALAVGGALAVQQVRGLYAPGPHLPRDGDRQRGEQLVELLRGIRGEVLMPYHPFYPVQAGKQHAHHRMGINDVSRATHVIPDAVTRLHTRLNGLLARRHFAAIVLDSDPRTRYDGLLGSYKLARYFSGDDVPVMISGYNTRPTYLFVPKRADPAPPDGRRVFGFESGRFDGWQVVGPAFGAAPAGGPVWDQGPVGPFEGAFLANSFHGGDNSRGSLISPEFEVDHPWLVYRVGGGKRAGELVVHLTADGQTVHVGSGPGSDIMRQEWVDVRAHRGKRMRVELLDRAVGPWGHLLFDDLTLRARRD